MKKLALAVSLFALVAVTLWVGPPLVGQENESSPRSAHLLDRGAPPAQADARGGTTPPTGPTPIFYPPAGPTAAPAPPGFGLPGVAFPPSAGAFVGNLFFPGVPGYPSSFLTAGAVSGFDVTGAFAWHLAPTPAASLARIFGAAAVAAGGPMPSISPALVAAGAFAMATPSFGTPAPSGIVGGPGIFAPPVRVTSPAVGIFCGLAVGAPGYPPIGAGPAGNGLGGISGAPVPPLRSAPVPLVTGAPVIVFPAPPAAYIAGCFADSATTPVELQSFHVE